MSIDRNKEYLVRLVRELVKTPKEIEWIEFKTNNSKPEEIGEQISALANSATLYAKSKAYLVWGIEDKTHNLIGTSFCPKREKRGNEELENWLLHLLDPHIPIHFFEVNIDGKEIIILEVSKAFSHPVKFKGEAFIRVGSYTKKLKDFPEKERALWRAFESMPFEELIAAPHLNVEEVLNFLDYTAYFSLMNQPLPKKMEKIVEALASDHMIRRSESDHWDIFNLGAILFSKKLMDFKSLKRKTVRVVLYRENTRVETIREQELSMGYGLGFENLIDIVKNLLPSNEIMGDALRKNVPYPILALRELIANAIIHQDFSVTGAGPMIEIFKNRVEITNPGSPLVDADRFLDKPPQSRNEALASFMRRIGICEERGSGIDKVIVEIENARLPAPLFETIGNNTKAVLFSYQPLNEMDTNFRIRACYLHACLKYITYDNMTNTSLRKRFGIEDKNSAIASRIIKETLKAGLIKLESPEVSKKYSKYIPYWA